MSILNVVIHREWRYAETPAEMAALVTEAMEHLRQETFEPYRSPAEDAGFMFSDRKHSGLPDMPNNYLRVAVNISTGYGTLIWFVTKGYPKSGGIYDQVWVSNSVNEPNFDPRVISDPGEPRLHSRRSAISIGDVRAVLEEFCRLRTGDRPECIGWTPGYANGRRLDEGEMDW